MKVYFKKDVTPDDNKAILYSNLIYTPDVRMECRAKLKDCIVYNSNEIEYIKELELILNVSFRSEDVDGCRCYFGEDIFSKRWDNPSEELLKTLNFEQEVINFIKNEGYIIKNRLKNNSGFSYLRPNMPVGGLYIKRDNIPDLKID